MEFTATNCPRIRQDMDEPAKSLSIDSDEQGDATLSGPSRSISTNMAASEPPRSEPLVAVNAMLTRGIDGFRRFFRRHAVCAQPRALFATDSKTSRSGPRTHCLWSLAKWTICPARPFVLKCT